MSNENVEDFYDAVIAAVRNTLTEVSKATWTPPAPIDPAKIKEALPSKKGEWLPLDLPPTPEFKAAREALPAHQPSYAGFQLVDVAHLGDFILIAFRWRETGNQIFVHTANLRSFVEQKCPVQWAEAIITTNLLEWLGTQWYQQHTLRQVKGLTFIEWNLPS